MTYLSLDTFKYKETLIEYEGPLLAIQEDPATQQLYYFYWVDIEDDHNIWYVSFATEEDINRVKDNTLSIHKALLSSPECRLVSMKNDENGEPYYASQLMLTTDNSIIQEYFDTEDYYLNEAH